MSDPREKAIALAQKLLATAAPSSGASENERAIAMQQAVKLIAENNLVLAPPKPKVRRQRPAPPPPPVVRTAPFTWPVYAPPPPRYYYPGSDWTEVEVSSDCVCGACGTNIYRGWPAWFNPASGRYRCHDIACNY